MRAPFFLRHSVDSTAQPSLIATRYVLQVDGYVQQLRSVQLVLLCGP